MRAKPTEVDQMGVDLARNGPTAAQAPEEAEQDVVLHIAHALVGASGVELGRRIARGVEAVGAVVGADYCVLVEYAPDGQVCSVTASLGTPAAVTEARPAREWDQARLRSGEAVIVTDLECLPAAAKAERDMLESAGITGAVVVPLGGADLRGTLSLYYASGAAPVETPVGAARVAGLMLLQAMARRRADAAADAAGARAQAFVEHLEDVVALVRSDDGIVVDLNPAVERIFGIPRQELVGQPVTTPLLAPCDPDTLEPLPPDRRASTLVRTGAAASVTQTFAFRRADGRWAWARQVVEPVDVGGVPHVVITVSDITAQREAERLRERSVLHDPITGIPTRRLLEARLAGLAQTVRARGGDVAVLHVELDGFDGLVDRLGYEGADQVVAALVREASQALPPGAVVARLSSGALGIVADVHRMAQARRLLHTVLSVVRQSRGNRGPVLMKAFGGGAVGGADEATDGTLFRRASAACRADRQRPGAAGTVWKGSSTGPVPDRRALEDDLAEALAQHQFELFYQPIVRLSDRTIVGAEALLRWHHPTQGLLLPRAFVDAAEASGLIVPIGAWCLEEVCRRFVPSHPTLTVSVNVSARQLGRGLTDHLREFLDRTSADPHLLQLELTEPTAASATEYLVSDLNTIRALGVQVGLDDFGTGHSPLTYLQDLHLDFVKIDRSFVRDCTDPASRGFAVVGAVLALAHQLDLVTVAEGVEDEACAAALLDRGAQLVQGYLFGRPAPLAEFTARVERDQHLPNARAAVAPRRQSRRPTSRAGRHARSHATPPGMPRLVTSKLTPPSARSVELRRQRLLDRLTAHDEPVVLISAPAGHGKSTLAAQWARAVPGPVAWVSLDPEDTDLRRFWLHVVTAVQRAAQADAGNGSGVTLPAVRAPAEALSSAVVEWLAHSPMRVVLDDYHDVRSAEIDESVGRLADRLPDRCQLVIVTRHDPLLPLSRWRAEGRLAELREPDLRLIRAEAAEFLTRVMGLSLPPEDLATLAERTEGWMSTLYLAGRAAERSVDAHQFVQSFRGSQRAVLGYLMDEVLSGLGEDQLRFLSSLAVLERFTPGLADAVTQGSGSAAQLRELERTNLLVIPLDEVGDWYRFHALLRDALLFELRNREPQREAVLHAQAAEWFSAGGYLEEAIRHAEASGNTELRREMLRRHWLTLLLSAQGPFVIERIAGFTPTDLEDPELALAAAYWAVEAGDYDRARAMLAVVEGPKGSRPFKNGLPSGAAGSALLRAHYPFEGVTAATAAAGRLPDLLPPGEPLWDALAGMATGIARWNAGDTDRAVELLEHASGAVDWALLHAVALPFAAHWRLDRGDGEGAAEAVAGARRAVDGAGITGDFRMCLVDLAEARLADASGDEAGATAALERSIARGEVEGRYEVRLYALSRAIPLMVRLLGDEAAAAAAREAEALLAGHPDSGRAGAAARQALEALDPATFRTLAVEPLSERERRVLRLWIGTALTQPEMAAELGITLNTVKTHVRTIYRKLGVSSRDDARARAEGLGLS